MHVILLFDLLKQQISESSHSAMKKALNFKTAVFPGSCLFLTSFHTSPSINSLLSVYFCGFQRSHRTRGKSHNLRVAIFRLENVIQ